jgi:hypothetical protein
MMTVIDIRNRRLETFNGFCSPQSLITVYASGHGCARHQCHSGELNVVGASLPL